MGGRHSAPVQPTGRHDPGEANRNRQLAGPAVSNQVRYPQPSQPRQHSQPYRANAPPQVRAPVNASAVSQPIAVGARPQQIVYQPPAQSEVPQNLMASALVGANAATKPVTMAQMMGTQGFLGGYFVGGPDDSGVCPASITFLLILIIIISIAIILSNYNPCSSVSVKPQKMQ
jgi:hypothetical protein